MVDGDPCGGVIAWGGNQWPIDPTTAIINAYPGDGLDQDLRRQLYDEHEHDYCASIGYSGLAYCRGIEPQEEDNKSEVIVIADKKGGSRRPGERGYTGSPNDTDNPYKHLRPDPKNPGKVIYKDPQTGKKISKPAPPGYVFPNKFNTIILGTGLLGCAAFAELCLPAVGLSVILQ